MSGTAGVRIADLPLLGAPNDAASIVGELGGSGLFTASALKAYIAASFISSSALAAETAARIAADAAETSTRFGADAAEAALRVAGDVGRRVNVLDYGADPTGVADSTTAINNALAASLAVHFPISPGAAQATYKVSAALNLRAGHHITCDGRRVVLQAVTASQVVLSAIAPSLALWNLRIGPLTIQAATGVSGVIGFFSRLASDITLDGLQFLGCTGNAISSDRGYLHKAINCVSRPSGALQAGNFSYVSTDDGAYIFYPIMRDCAVHTEDELGLAAGAVSPCVRLRRTVGAVLDNFIAERLNLPTANTVDAIQIENDCQGTEIIGGVTYGAKNGVIALPGTGPAVAPGYLKLLGHDIDFFSTAGVNISATALAASTDIKVHDCIITAPQGAGTLCITVANTLRLSVQGNTCDQYGALDGKGIQLAAVNSAIVTGNKLNNLITGVGLAGTAVVNAQIINNIFTNNTNNLIGDLTGGGSGTNRVRDNLGVEPAAITVITPAVPASDAAVLNSLGVDVVVYVYGGNGVTIGINGITTGVLFSPSGGEPKGGNALLTAGSTISMHYSGAPTWVWIPV